MTSIVVLAAPHEMERRMPSGDTATPRQRGVTYLAVLLTIAIMGVWLAATGTLWSSVSKRDKERALLDTGHAYRDAIRRYYERTPGVVPRYPASLEELVLDSRYVYVVRHMRKLYSDPMTGEADWRIVPAPDGGIMGVYSQSKNEPLKTGNFRFADASFQSASGYADWKFVYVPEIPLVQSAMP